MNLTTCPFMSWYIVMPGRSRCISVNFKQCLQPWPSHARRNHTKTHLNKMQLLFFDTGVTICTVRPSIRDKYKNELNWLYHNQGRLIWNCKVLSCMLENIEKMFTLKAHKGIMLMLWIFVLENLVLCNEGMFFIIEFDIFEAY